MAISDNQRDDNADTRQKNQPDSVISNGVWYEAVYEHTANDENTAARKRCPAMPLGRDPVPNIG